MSRRMYCIQPSTGYYVTDEGSLQNYQKPLNKPNYRAPKTDCNGRHRIVALEEVAGSRPVGHPPHKPAVDRRSGSSGAYLPYRVEGAFSEVRVL